MNNSPVGYTAMENTSVPLAFFVAKGAGSVCKPFITGKELEMINGNFSTKKKKILTNQDGHKRRVC